MKFKNHDFREEELRKGIVDFTYYYSLLYCSGSR
jgi:hypothetical protein